MTETQAWILLVEVGLVALWALLVVIGIRH